MPKRYLISRLSALGDVVCTLPVAVALKELDPESEITWAVDPRFAGAIECCEAVDHVIPVKPDFSSKSWFVSEMEFDAALDMQGLLKSGLVVAKAHANQKVGYHWQREGSWLFSRRVNPDPSSFHVVDQYVDVARSLGASVHQAHFGLKPVPSDVEAVTQKLLDKGIRPNKASHSRASPEQQEPAKPLVVFNAGAGWATKRWPPEHFASLANELTGLNMNVIFLGSSSSADRAAFEAVVASGLRGGVSMLGETSVRELIALIWLADAHVGGDTGSSHIAAALEIPAIGLYSLTYPERTCPYGQIHRCHYDPNSLASIKPSDVLKTVLQAIS